MSHTCLREHHWITLLWRGRDAYKWWGFNLPAAESYSFCGCVNAFLTCKGHILLGRSRFLSVGVKHFSVDLVWRSLWIFEVEPHDISLCFYFTFIVCGTFHFAISNWWCQICVSFHPLNQWFSALCTLYMHELYRFI